MKHKNDRKKDDWWSSKSFIGSGHWRMLTLSQLNDNDIDLGGQTEVGTRISGDDIELDSSCTSPSATHAQ